MVLERRDDIKHTQRTSEACRTPQGCRRRILRSVRIGILEPWDSRYVVQGDGCFAAAAADGFVLSLRIGFGRSAERLSFRPSVVRHCTCNQSRKRNGRAYLAARCSAALTHYSALDIEDKDNHAINQRGRNNGGFSAARFHVDR